MNPVRWRSCRPSTSTKPTGYHDIGITSAHTAAVADLPPMHKDPFDRFLIAQALAEDMVLVSNEALFDGFAVQRLW